jgi:hypothetical protein
MSRTLSAYGISATALQGWDVRIDRRQQLTVRAPASSAPVGGYVHPVLHAANSRLPVLRGDYGSGYVETMSSSNVFVSLAEFDSEAGATELFDQDQPRALRSADFHPETQQRVIAGMCGAQRFFTHNGRAFCLYVVLGSWARRQSLVRTVNSFVSTVGIAPR